MVIPGRHLHKLLKLPLQRQELARLATSRPDHLAQTGGEQRSPVSPNACSRALAGMAHADIVGWRRGLNMFEDPHFMPGGTMPAAAKQHSYMARRLSASTIPSTLVPDLDFTDGTESYQCWNNPS